MVTEEDYLNKHIHELCEYKRNLEISFRFQLNKHPNEVDIDEIMNSKLSNSIKLKLLYIKQRYSIIETQFDFIWSVIKDTIHSI